MLNKIVNGLIVWLLIVLLINYQLISLLLIISNIAINNQKNILVKAQIIQSFLTCAKRFC